MMGVRSPSPDDVKLGHIIRRRRYVLRMSQRELGIRLGVTWQQVHKYENGKSRVAFGRLVTITQALDITLQDVAREFLA